MENDIFNMTCGTNGSSRPPKWIINGTNYNLGELRNQYFYYSISVYSISLLSYIQLNSTSFQCVVIDNEDRLYKSHVGFLNIGNYIILLIPNHSPSSSSNYICSAMLLSSIGKIYMTVYRKYLNLGTFKKFKDCMK